MQTDLSQALHSAAARTFEELCFVCAEQWDGEVPLPPLVHGARVSFTGPQAGHLDLRLSADALPTLAALMLAVEQASAVMQVDALGELANVICGNLLPAVAGRQAVFRLGSPTPLLEATSAPVAHALLQLDIGAADVRLHLR